MERDPPLGGFSPRLSRNWTRLRSLTCSRPLRGSRSWGRVRARVGGPDPLQPSLSRRPLETMLQASLQTFWCVPSAGSHPVRQDVVKLAVWIMERVS